MGDKPGSETRPGGTPSAGDAIDALFSVFDVLSCLFDLLAAPWTW